MSKFRGLIIAFICGSLIAISNAAVASAASYTVQENRAWSALLRTPFANTVAKEFGKSNAVGSMRWVCDELDSGATFNGVSGQWVRAASEFRAVWKQKGFLAYGAGLSVSAVLWMCPWHRNAAGLR